MLNMEIILCRRDLLPENQWVLPSQVELGHFAPEYVKCIPLADLVTFADEATGFIYRLK